MFVYFFFFKQKTAYDMRISDWSSDVCSSDLATPCRMPMAGDCFAALAMTDYGSAQVQPPRANPRTMLRTLALSLAAALLPLSGAAADEPAQAPRQTGAAASIAFPSATTTRTLRLHTTSKAQQKEKSGAQV